MLRYLNIAQRLPKGRFVSFSRRHEKMPITRNGPFEYTNGFMSLHLNLSAKKKSKKCVLRSTRQNRPTTICPAVDTPSCVAPQGGSIHTWNRGSPEPPMTPSPKSGRSPPLPIVSPRTQALYEDGKRLQLKWIERIHDPPLKVAFRDLMDQQKNLHVSSIVSNKLRPKKFKEHLPRKPTSLHLEFEALDGTHTRSRESEKKYVDYHDLLTKRAEEAVKKNLEAHRNKSAEHKAAYSLKFPRKAPARYANLMKIKYPWGEHSDIYTAKQIKQKKAQQAQPFFYERDGKLRQMLCSTQEAKRKKFVNDEPILNRTKSPRKLKPVQFSATV